MTTPLAVAVGEGVLRRRHTGPSFDRDDRAVLEEAHELGANGLFRGPARPVDLPLEQPGKVDGARMHLEAVATGQKIEEDALTTGEHDRASRLGGR